MQREPLDYLKTQRVGVIAIEMLDGSPHGATIHFAHSEDPLVFYFMTNKPTRKSEPLHARAKSRATFVVGFDEAHRAAFQLDGEAELVQDPEKSQFDAVYFGKFPEKKAKVDDSSVYLKFTPTWWRFSDFSRPEGKLIISSDK